MTVTLPGRSCPSFFNRLSGIFDPFPDSSRGSFCAFLDRFSGVGCCLFDGFSGFLHRTLVLRPDEP